MKKEIKDLTGRKFGRLTVLERGPNDNSRGTRWWCRCECGKKVLVSRHNLMLGIAKSCSCYQKEKARKNGKQNKKYNTYDLSGDFGKGYTLKGEEFWFDKEDYDKIKDYCWYFDQKNGYLYTKLPDTNKKITFHRLIMGFPKGKMIDHIAHEAFNKYDNRKCNLRICTMKENARNTKLPKTNTSGIKGVYLNKKLNKWCANIGFQRKTIYLGVFENKEDAIKARKTAEEKYFGEFAYKDNFKLIETALEDEGIL